MICLIVAVIYLALLVILSLFESGVEREMETMRILREIEREMEVLKEGSV